MATLQAGYFESQPLYWLLWFARMATCQKKVDNCFLFKKKDQCLNIKQKVQRIKWDVFFVAGFARVKIHIFKLPSQQLAFFII